MNRIRTRLSCVTMALAVVAAAGYGPAHAAPIMIDDLSTGFEQVSFSETGSIPIAQNMPGRDMSVAVETVGNPSSGMVSEVNGLLLFSAAEGVAASLRLHYDLADVPGLGGPVDITDLPGLSLAFTAINPGTDQFELPIWFRLYDSEGNTAHHTASVGSVDPLGSLFGQTVAQSTLVASFSDFERDAGFDDTSVSHVRVWINEDQGSMAPGASWILLGGAEGGLVIIPEPASLALMGIGGLLLLRRRRHPAQA